MLGLAGTTVAILEARRSAELAKLLEHEGASVYIAPALREEVEEAGDVDRFVEEVCAGAFDQLVLLTGAGTRALVAAGERLGRRPELLTALGRVPLLCRGPKPVAALRTFGLTPGYTTPSPYTTEQLLDVARGIYPVARRTGLVLHGGGSDELVEGLRALGTEVRPVRVYHWALPDDVSPIRRFVDLLQEGRIQAVAFTSASQIENLVTISSRFGESDTLLRLLACVDPIVAVGPVCAAALRSHGLPVHVEPAEPKMGPMVLTLSRYVAAQRESGTATATRPSATAG